MWTSCSGVQDGGCLDQHAPMPFLNGTVTYARFAVTGNAPELLDQSIIDAMSANAARPTPIGVPTGRWGLRSGLDEPRWRTSRR